MFVASIRKGMFTSSGKIKLISLHSLVSIYFARKSENSPTKSRTTKENLEEASGNIEKEDALNRAHERDGVRTISERMGCIRQSPLREKYRIKTE